MWKSNHEANDRIDTLQRTVKLSSGAAKEIGSVTIT